MYGEAVITSSTKTAKVYGASMVAVYGSFKSNPISIFMQGGLPIIGLVTLLLLH